MNNKNSQISFDRSFGMDFNLLRLVGAWSKDTRTAECASSNTSHGENAGNNILEIDLSASTKSEMYYYLIQTPTEPISGRFIKISY